MAPVVIDCNDLAPTFAASYLLREGDEAAFIEANAAPALPRLLGALEQAGLDRRQVRWLFVTHAHLDHAGGAWALLEACPEATLLAHPRAAGHLVDPSRLTAGARKVYGDADFVRLYGDLRPIDPARVRSVEDGGTLCWGGRTWTFLHTRGHANHHACLHDDRDGTFTGDTFGLCYPALQGRGTFVLPSTSPTDFDPEAALASVARIEALGGPAWPTHFGRLDDVPEAAAQLRTHLAFSARLLEEATTVEESQRTAFCDDRLRRHVDAALRAQGLPIEAARAHLDLDLRLNAQGIAHAAGRRLAR